MKLIELRPPADALTSSTLSGWRNCLKPLPQPALSVMVESPMRMIFILWLPFVVPAADTPAAKHKTITRKRKVAFKRPKVTPQNLKADSDFVQIDLKFLRSRNARPVTTFTR